MTLIQTQKGFTFIEIMVTVAITGAIAALIGAFQSDVFTYTKIIDTSLKNQEGARKILRPFASEVRSAAISDIGAFPIAIAGTSTLSFYTNIDGDELREQVTYYLEDASLKKDVIKPSGNPLVYDVGNATTETLVTDIVSTDSVFEYFDETYDGSATSTPLIQPVTPSDIRLIKVSVIIDSDPSKAPPPFEVTTQVGIRNLKVSL